MIEKMKNSISLRGRITLIIFFIVTFLCFCFMSFSIFNAKVHLIDPWLQDRAMIVVLQEDLSEKDLEKMEEEKDLKSFEKYVKEIPFEIQIFSKYSIYFMIGVIIVTTTLTYILAGFAIKPIYTLTEKVSEIDKNQLSNRIKYFTNDKEINILVDTFNEMLERLEETFEREARFSSDAAHELRTPLTVIRTDLDVLFLDEIPAHEDCLESLEVVKNQTNRMISLVNGLLLLSNANNFEIIDYASIDKMVMEILKELKPFMNRRNLELELKLDTCELITNAVMLKHAISNIIENGIKYNVENGKLEIILKNEINKCSIIVSDSGKGITKDELKHLFEPYYRSDKSRSKKVDGLGLGLSIAKEIIEKHKGKLIYEPSKLGGSTFIIELLK